MSQSPEVLFQHIFQSPMSETRYHPQIRSDQNSIYLICLYIYTQKKCSHEYNVLMYILLTYYILH